MLGGGSKAETTGSDGGFSVPEISYMALDCSRGVAASIPGQDGVGSAGVAATPSA